MSTSAERSPEISVAHKIRLTLQSLFNLFSSLSYAQHDTCLGQELLACLLCRLFGFHQNVQTLLESSSSITDKGCTSFNRLDVVRKDIQTRYSDFVDCIDTLVGEIGRKGFNEDTGCLLLDFGYCRRNVSCSSICEVVSINTGQDDVA